MIKRYLPTALVILSLAVLIIACDNTSTPLTKVWRVEGTHPEYINEAYAFDSKGNMIVQKLKYDDDLNQIYSLHKLNSSGQAQWSVPASGWNELEIDNNDNIYSFFLYEDFVSGRKYRIVKYSSGGTILWQKNDIAEEYSLSIDYYTSLRLAHALDPAGNLIIQGPAASAGDQYRIIKIDQNGNELWRVNTGASMSRLINDTRGDIYIGNLITITQNEEYGIRVLKYNGADGSLLWDKICIRATSGHELGNYTLQTDSSNNLLVAHSETAAHVNKFDASSGDQIWEYAYNPSDVGVSKDVEATVKCDSSGNIIISAVVSVLTGLIPGASGSFPFPTGYDYCQLIKVDANGKKSWSKKVSSVMIYNGDMGGQLNVDRENNIYVFCLDNALMKYNTSGKKLWSYTPEITNVTAGQMSEWHVDSELNLYWILQCGALQNDDGSYYNGYWITKYSQE